MIQVVVYGRPAPQGSKSHVGNGRMIESSRYVKAWRLAVHEACLHAAGHPLDGHLSTQFVFSLSRPAAAKNRPYPNTMPDLSKLVRSTEDAMKTGGLIHDDARIVQIVASKVYAGSDKPGALATPGAVIKVWRLEP